MEVAAPETSAGDAARLLEESVHCGPIGLANRIGHAHAVDLSDSFRHSRFKASLCNLSSSASMSPAFP